MQPPNSQEAVILGVIADTHVPDRSARMHPRVWEVFQDEGVHEIIHAGDISSPKVLRQLTEIAPVHAVRGNRDVYLLRHLPSRLQLTYHDTTIGVTHGHGGLKTYFTEKLQYLLGGFRFDHYQKILDTAFPSVDVIVYGHSHRPDNRWIEGTLYFNPGCAGAVVNKFPRGIGLLTIHPGGNVAGKLIQLEID